MLADQLDFVLGVDPHRDTHALAIVDVRSGGIVLETSVSASSSGDARAFELAQEHAQGRRAFRDRRNRLFRRRPDTLSEQRG